MCGVSIDSLMTSSVCGFAGYVTPHLLKRSSCFGTITNTDKIRLQLQQEPPVSNKQGVTTLPQTRFRFFANGVGMCIGIAVIMAFVGALLLTHIYRTRIALTATIAEMRGVNDDPNQPADQSALIHESWPQLALFESESWQFVGQRVITASNSASHDLDDYHYLSLDGPFQLFRITDTFVALVKRNPPPLLIYTNQFSSPVAIFIDQHKIVRHLRPFFLSSFIGQLLVFILAGLIIIRVMRFHLIKPLDDLVATLNEFSADPAIAMPVPISMKNQSEYRDAALALERLQRNTLLALRQRQRLADIGEAVAKINHDICNALSSATLVADTMLASEDPKIRRTAPFVVRSLEQAVDLCQSMLDYLVESPTPNPERILIRPLVDELSEQLGATITYDGPEQIFVDRSMITRILTNLIRNAVIAGAKDVFIDIWKAGRLAVIDIADNGPGIPEHVWHDLFLAFRTTSREGTGLGLAITRDLAVALGGNIKLARSGDTGSEFRLQLPEQIFNGATPNTSRADQ